MSCGVSRPVLKLCRERMPTQIRLAAVWQLLIVILLQSVLAQEPGAITGTTDAGFYQLYSSAASMIYMPSVDAYLVAETSTDYQNYPGLRRLILMDAAGNYLTEYSPPA